MVLAKGLRRQSGYCWARTDKVAWRAVSTLDGRVLIAFVVSFASAMRQLECKSGVSPRFPANQNNEYTCFCIIPGNWELCNPLHNPWFPGITQDDP